MKLALHCFIFYLISETYVQCRPCRSRRHVLAKAKIEAQYTEEIEESSGELKLVRIFNWTVADVEESDYDGFLVRLQYSTTRGGLIFIPPYQDCQASSSHLWIQSNDSSCGFENTTKTECNFIAATTPDEDSSCLVDKSSASAYDGLTYRCSGSTSMMSTKYPRTGHYYSLPQGRQSVKYLTEFNKNYMLSIFLYKRQFLSHGGTPRVKSNWLCAETLAKTRNLDILEAGQKCCEWNVSSMVPTDLQMGEFILDRRSQTLNVTVSWIPPSPDESLMDVFRLIRFNESPVKDYAPQMTEQITEGKIEGTGNCPLDKRRQVSTIYNLLPNKKYFMMAAAYYTGDYKAVCGKGLCSVSKNFVAEFNPCDETWTKCEDDFKCIIINVVGEVIVPETICVRKESSDYEVTTTTQKSASSIVPRKQTNIVDKTKKEQEIKQEITESTTLVTEANLGFESTAKADNISIQLSRNEKILQGKLCEQNPHYCDDSAVCASNDELHTMICSCSAGLVGDGISRLHNGTGCSGCPIISDCDFMANCVPLENPSEGFKCQCDEHHYGDGRKSGTGCRSRPKRTATIVVPVVLLGLIVFAIILWCLCFSSSKKSRRSNNIPL